MTNPLSVRAGRQSPAEPAVGGGVLAAYEASPVVRALVGRILVGVAPEALSPSQLDA